MEEATPITPLADARSRSHEALRVLVSGTSATGRAFFEALVLGLTRALGVRHALVGEVADATFSQARTLAVAWDGVISENFLYSLAGSPCEKVLAVGETAYYPRDVDRLFPQDVALARRGIKSYMGTPLWSSDGETKLGLLVLLHDAPLDQELEPRALIEVFAGRAAAELERSRSEDQLRASEDRLRTALEAAQSAGELLRTERDFSRAVVENTATAVVVLGTDGRIAYANERAGEIAGVSREALLGAPGEAAAGAAAHPVRLAPEESVARLLARGEAVHGEQVELVRASGERRFLLASGAPLRDSSGRITSAVITAEDLTELRHLQQQLIHSQKMEAVGRLAGGVAHDFNNLLTAILSYAHLAEVELEGRAAEYVEPIREAAERAASLTRQLLAFARRQSASPRVIDLNAKVADLSRMLGRLLGESVELRTRLAPGLWPVRVDPGQLEQVLVNLAVNARDAMPAGGTLWVEGDNATLAAGAAGDRSLEAGDWVRLRVVDTGTGMDEETRRRAFEPFFTTKAPDRGTGLGLSMCHGIVEQHGGRIWVESVLGRGTAVEILLPRHLGLPEERPGEVAPADLPRGQESVLVVEDEATVRTMAVRVLQGLGYRVSAAADAEEALASLAEDGRPPFDLLFTDVVLPRVDGRELAARACQGRPSLRVLLTTGYSEVPLASGPAALPSLAKPYTPVELARKVREVLEG